MSTEDAVSRFLACQREMYAGGPTEGMAFFFAAIKFTLLAPVYVYPLLGWLLTRRRSKADHSATSSVSTAQQA